jgi:hypothetical protein
LKTAFIIFAALSGSGAWRGVHLLPVRNHPVRKVSNNLSLVQILMPAPGISAHVDLEIGITTFPRGSKT